MVDMVEVHESYTSRQWSLMTQMFVFLIANAALIIYFITPFEDTLSPLNLRGVAEVLLLNNLLSPILNYCRVSILFNRAVHAPFALSKKKMASYFAAEQANLGESYAQCSQAIFVAAFFLPIMPTGMLLTSFGLLFRYYVDKHSLLHRWERQAEMGPTMLATSCWHMMIACICAVCMSHRYYSRWPFDNTCIPGGTANYGTAYSCDRDAKIEHEQIPVFYKKTSYMDDDQRFASDGFKVSRKSELPKKCTVLYITASSSSIQCARAITDSFFCYFRRLNPT
jgi:hypothetical protein